VRTGMPIRYDNPTEVGADRVVNAVAARERYGAPVIVVDFGTATTFDVVNAAGGVRRGIISPGIMISPRRSSPTPPALPGRRAQARRADRQEHGGRDAGRHLLRLHRLVDGILERLLAEIPGVKTVVATGARRRSSLRLEVHPRSRQMLTLVGL